MHTVARGEFQPSARSMRVDEDVDLAALVGGERLGEPRRWRSAGDRLRLQAGGAELLREVVRVLDACGVHDPGRRAEALAIEARRGVVQSLVVERGCEGALLEVAADDGHGVDRGGGGTRRQRSGAISPRRAASPSGRSSTEAGKTSETCFAISCSVAVMPM